MKKVTIVFLVLTIFFQLSISFILASMSESAGSILIQFSFTEQAFIEIVSRWNEFDRAKFLLHYYPDMIYPFVYSVFLYFCARDLGINKSFMRLAPIAAGGDLIENILHVLMLNNNITVSSAYVFLAATAALIKWLCIAILLSLIAFNLRKRFKERS